MGSTAATVEQYLAELPPERVEPVRELYTQIHDHIDPAFIEGMQYGMVGWSVPHSRYPAGYHTASAEPVPFMALANKRGHIAVYHMGIYADADVEQWFVDEYAKTGWRLNMGASCIRFTAMRRIPFALIGELAGRIDCETFIRAYEANDPRIRR